MATTEDKVEEKVADALEEKIATETDTLIKDVEEITDHAEKQVDEEMEKIDTEVKVEEKVADALEEKIATETDALVKDVEEIAEHAEKQVDKEMEKIDKEVKELHEDAKEEVTEIKEDVKEQITIYSRFIAGALYVWGCVSALVKRKEELQEENIDVKSSVVPEESKPEESK